MDKIEMDKIEAGQGERVLRKDELDTIFKTAIVIKF